MAAAAPWPLGEALPQLHGGGQAVGWGLSSLGTDPAVQEAMLTVGETGR